MISTNAKSICSLYSIAGLNYMLIPLTEFDINPRVPYNYPLQVLWRNCGIYYISGIKDGVLKSDGEFKRSSSDIEQSKKVHYIVYRKDTNKWDKWFSEIRSVDLGNYFCTVIRTEFPNIFSIRFYFWLYDRLQDHFIRRGVLNQEINSEKNYQGIIIALRK